MMAFSEKMKKSKNYVLYVALITVVLVKAILQTLMITFKISLSDINHSCISKVILRILVMVF